MLVDSFVPTTTASSIQVSRLCHTVRDGISCFSDSEGEKCGFSSVSEEEEEESSLGVRQAVVQACLISFGAVVLRSQEVRGLSCAAW